MFALNLDTRVCDVVIERPATARIFEEHGIDYCCNGGISVGVACERRGLDPARLLEELVALDVTEEAPDLTERGLTELADYIEATHHEYLRAELPSISHKIDKVARVHGDRDPRLRQLQEVFTAFRRELEMHMQKEEQVLFPLCRQLESASQLVGAPCGSVEMPISVMISEHDDAGDALAKMRDLTDQFVPGEGACNTHRALLAQLVELEKDMHRHVHAENYILFPRALEREKSLEAGR